MNKKILIFLTFPWREFFTSIQIRPVVFRTVKTGWMTYKVRWIWKLMPSKYKVRWFETRKEAA